MSMHMLRFPRPTSSHGVNAGRRCSGSILITSAPYSASVLPQVGPSQDDAEVEDSDTVQRSGHFLSPAAVAIGGALYGIVIVLT